MTLDQLKPGQTAIVSGFKQHNDSFRRKLLAFGLTPKTEVKMIRMAPLGDPIEIQLRGFCLTLRKEEASYVNVKIGCNTCNQKSCCY